MICRDLNTKRKLGPMESTPTACMVWAYHIGLFRFLDAQAHIPLSFMPETPHRLYVRLPKHDTARATAADEWKDLFQQHLGIRKARLSLVRGAWTPRFCEQAEARRYTFFLERASKHHACYIKYFIYQDIFHGRKAHFHGRRASNLSSHLVMALFCNTKHDKLFELSIMPHIQTPCPCFVPN